MKSLLCSLLVLGGCGVADAEEASQASFHTLGPVVGDYDGLPLEDLTHADVRGTARSMEVVLDEVRGLSAEDRAAAQAAVRDLAVSCPYNRGAIQLALALEEVSNRHVASGMSPLIERQWAQLQLGLDLHRKVLVELDVAELPLPGEGDYLSSRLSASALVDAETLAGDPLTPTGALIDETMDVVRNYEPEVQDRIDGNRALAGAYTIDSWPFEDHLIGWRSAMQRMEPFITDADQAAEVHAMIELINDFVSTFC